jgi:hypothetical protein
MWKAFVKVAVGILRIECVDSLRSPVVAMLSLRPHRFATESHLVRPKFLSMRHKHKLSLALVNNDTVYLDTRLLREQGPACEQEDAR